MTREEGKAALEAAIPVLRKHGADFGIYSLVPLPPLLVLSEDGEGSGMALGVPAFDALRESGLSKAVQEISTMLPNIPIFALDAPVIAAIGGNPL